MFACSEYRSDCKCKWELKYEYAQCNESCGWTLLGARLEHNHSLMQTTPEVMARGSGRLIPESFVPLGELLAASGLTAKHIFTVFQTKAAREGDVLKCLYDDVYDKFCRGVSVQGSFDEGSEESFTTTVSS